MEPGGWTQTPSRLSLRSSLFLNAACWSHDGWLFIMTSALLELLLLLQQIQPIYHLHLDVWWMEDL